MDLAGFDQPFTDVFGTAQARTDWFEQLLNLAMTTALVGTFDDFTTLGKAALSMVAAQRGVSLREEQIEHIAGHIGHLPAYTDAHPALERLWDITGATAAGCK
ncbi:MAG: haloacid dehalogenase type II, partial [Pseudomonadota bacterium]|nr:haloacid dehalogenase type II [Pseudomonadota bacterium]